jgi:hypothetical protein
VRGGPGWGGGGGAGRPPPPPRPSSLATVTWAISKIALDMVGANAN